MVLVNTNIRYCHPKIKTKIIDKIFVLQSIWYLLIIGGAIWWGIQTYILPKPKDEKATPTIENTTPIKQPIEEKRNENQPPQSEQKKNPLSPDSVSLKTMKNDS